MVLINFWTYSGNLTTRVNSHVDGLLGELFSTAGIPTSLPRNAASAQAGHIQIQVTNSVV